MMSTALKHCASSIAALYSTHQLYTIGVCVPCSVTLEASWALSVSVTVWLESQSRVKTQNQSSWIKLDQLGCTVKIVKCSLIVVEMYYVHRKCDTFILSQTQRLSQRLRVPECQAQLQWHTEQCNVFHYSLTRARGTACVNVNFSS
jgi:hypothetical protein